MSDPEFPIIPVQQQVYPGLQVIIDILKKAGPEQYDQSWAGTPQEKRKGTHACGTPCCIGGHAAIELRRREYLAKGFATEEELDDPECSNLLMRDRDRFARCGIVYYNDSESIVTYLSRLCDIPYDISHHICWNNTLPNTTLEAAIRMLEYCRDTGIASWPRAMNGHI